MTSVSPTQTELMKIATLKKPYGIQGWLWVFSDMDERSAIFDMPNWLMKTATGFKPLTVSKWRAQGSGLVASFKEISDRNVAETMSGTTIWVYKGNLPVLPDDEYYWSDLVGLRVINEQNEMLGVVKHLFETGAHDIMTIAPTKDSIDNEERLIPWHKTTVLSVVLSENSELGHILVAWKKDY